MNEYIIPLGMVLGLFYTIYRLTKPPTKPQDDRAIQDSTAKIEGLKGELKPAQEAAKNSLEEYEKLKKAFDAANKRNNSNGTN